MFSSRKIASSIIRYYTNWEYGKAPLFENPLTQNTNFHSGERLLNIRGLGPVLPVKLQVMQARKSPVQEKFHRCNELRKFLTRKLPLESKKNPQLWEAFFVQCGKSLYLFVQNEYTPGSSHQGHTGLRRKFSTLVISTIGITLDWNCMCLVNVGLSSTHLVWLPHERLSWLKISWLEQLGDSGIL